MTERQEPYAVPLDLSELSARASAAHRVLEAVETLISHIEYLQATLAAEQQARWAAEQDARRWQEEADKLADRLAAMIGARND